MGKYLFIDIRKSDEVYSKHFDQSNEYSFYNIPMNMIRFNAPNIITHLNYYDEIFIVCQSAKRSQFLKNKYFRNYPNIKVSKLLQFSNLKYGKNNINLGNDNLNINIIGSNSFNFYNVMRILQTFMGILILSVVGYTYSELKNKKLINKFNNIPLIVLGLFGLMALYNGLTSTCGMSFLLRNYLN